MMHIQNVPRQNVPGTKRPKGQNVPRGQMRPIIEQGVASYLIQYGQDKGKTYPNLPIIRITPIQKLSSLRRYSVHMRPIT